MTAQGSDRGGNIEEAPLLQVILATHSREVQTALFHSLNAISTIKIVATGTSTAELVNYSDAFRPDIAIVETGLPGRPLCDALIELGKLQPTPRVLLIGEDAGLKGSSGLSAIEIYADLDLLIDAISDKGADAQ